MSSVLLTVTVDSAGAEQLSEGKLASEISRATLKYIIVATYDSLS